MIPSYILYRYFASIKIPTWMQLNLLKLIFLINSSNTLITFKSKDKRVRELNIAESEGDSHGPAGWCCHVNKRSMSHYSEKKSGQPPSKHFQAFYFIRNIFNFIFTCELFLQFSILLKFLILERKVKTENLQIPCQ